MGEVMAVVEMEGVMEAAAMAVALAGTCIELRSRRSRFQLSIGQGRRIDRSAILRDRLDIRHCLRMYMYWSTTWVGAKAGVAKAGGLAVVGKAVVKAVEEMVEVMEAT